jgi:osmotically inducible protein OsmC
MPVREASAVWEGSLREGKGTAKFATFEGAYSFPSRFESGEGTNPEEMLGAAHAACFSMALSAELGRNNFAPERVSTVAHVHLEKGDAGFGITKIELVTEAVVPDIDDAKFQEIANTAKTNCPISKALSPDITLKATLV